MILTVADAGLAQLLASKVLLTKMWPSGSHEVLVIMQVLRISPRLADALTFGLLALMTPLGGSRPAGELVVAYKTVVVMAVARRPNGELVVGPQTRSVEVGWLDVADVAVGGQSGVRMTG
jgi:hypothetical protein